MNRALYVILIAFLLTLGFQARAFTYANDRDVQVKPLWEAKRPYDGRDWTLYAFNVVNAYGTNLKRGSYDVTRYCPRYRSLSENQKTNFWVYLVSAMVKYESSFNPLTRYTESTMGIDQVTKRQVVSEGLLQLSYQDGLWYTFCNQFNWATDKYLSPTSSRKTILSPYKNLRCGIRILDRLVGRKQYIAFNSGHYWSVLRPANPKEALIRGLTNTIPFCKR